jgi:hypothetical protein
MAQERGGVILGEIAQGDPPGREPPTEVSGHPEQIPGRQRRVALSQQLRPEPIYVCPKRALHPDRIWIEHAGLLDGEVP